MTTPKPSLGLALVLGFTSLLFGCASAGHDTPDPHAAAAGGTAHAAPAGPGVTADEALHRLMDGNKRFVEGHRMARADEPAVRTSLAASQKPIAVVVCCADSRVGPELVFDQGLGDIFVVRTAGEVMDDAALGSIEYAVEHLGSPLILVVGHERCGAVSAAVAGGEAPGHVGALVKAIQPAVAATRGQPGDALDNAVRANVRDVVRALRDSQPILAEFVHRGALTVKGARYDLDTGEVEMVPEN
jgi:carbonic anhydrase